MAKLTKETPMSESGELTSRIVCQIAAILVLSFALGLAYNASSPIGIVWSGTERSAGHKPLASLLPDTNQARQGLSTVTLSNTNSIPTPVQISQSNLLAASTNAAPGTTNTTNAVEQTPPPLRYAHGTTWAQTKPLADAGKAVLLDARGKWLYDAGHIPGAISLPEGSPADEFVAFQKRYGTNAHVVVYCSSTSCSLSAKVANKLVQEYGFHNVEYMTGGYQEWQQAELATKQTNSNEQAVKP
jgi:rhodanese-related sulfurtransferase